MELAMGRLMLVATGMGIVNWPLLGRTFLGGFLRDFNLITENMTTQFCIVWHLGEFGSMQNTPTGCGIHLPTILITFKTHSKSENANHFPTC
jgi:hypothetical protein